MTACYGREAYVDDLHYLEWDAPWDADWWAACERLALAPAPAEEKVDQSDNDHPEVLKRQCHNEWIEQQIQLSRQHVGRLREGGCAASSEITELHAELEAAGDALFQQGVTINRLHAENAKLHGRVDRLSQRRLA